jgi:Multidrug resistance efflux pump
VLADEDFARYQALFKDGSVSERKFQEATKTHKTARADVQIAEARLAQAEANRKQASIAGQQLEAAKHGVRQANAALDLARLGDLQIAAAKQLVAERSRQVAEAGRALELAQVNLGYTRVVAPLMASSPRNGGTWATMPAAGDPIVSMYNPELSM